MKLTMAPPPAPVVDAFSVMAAKTFSADRRLAAESLRRQGMSEEMVAGALGLTLPQLVEHEKVEAAAVEAAGGPLKFGHLSDASVAQAIVDIALRSDNERLRFDVLKYIHMEKLGRNVTAAGIQQAAAQQQAATVVNVNVAIQRARGFVEKFANGSSAREAAQVAQVDEVPQ